MPAVLIKSVASVPKSISGPPGLVCKLAGAVPALRDSGVGSATAMPAFFNCQYSNQSLATLTAVVPVVGMTDVFCATSLRSIGGYVLIGAVAVVVATTPDMPSL